MPATHRKAAPETSYLQNLHDRAKVRPVDNFASIRTYYRSADLLLRQAEQYRLLGNDEELYVMLLRFISVVLETLPKHVSFVSGDTKYQQLKKDLITVYLPEAERIKAGLKLRQVVDSLEKQGAFQTRKTAGTVLLSAGNLPEIHWDDLALPGAAAGAAAAVATAAAPLAPPAPAGAQLGVPQPEGFDLLSSLMPASSVAAPAVTSISMSQSTAALLASLAPSAHPSAPPMPALPELSSSLRLPAASQATLSKHALLPSGSFGSSSSSSAYRQGISPDRQQLPAAQHQRPLYPELAALEPPPPPPQQQQQQQAASLDAALASLDVSSQQPQQADGLQPPLGAQHQQQPPQPPYPAPSPYNELQLGPQEVGVMSAPRPTQPLPPDATCCEPGAGQIVPAPPQPPSQPQPPSSGGVAEVKRLQTIRDVHVSVALMDEFMRYAVSNTRRGIESCGILAGTLSADDAVFTITTLIVPKQKGTSDTVEMLNEEEIFEVQDSRALYPLGWIHTHPTQTCFLSSVDIHTHCGFQTMLDEAVAIVMAPKDQTKRVGIFRLSTPGGLKLVQRCPQRGFHPHPPTETGQPVYELCGHVYLNPRAKYEVVDLR